LDEGGGDFDFDAFVVGEEGAAVGDGVGAGRVEVMVGEVPGGEGGGDVVEDVGVGVGSERVRVRSQMVPSLTVSRTDPAVSSPQARSSGLADQM
jgi:hypothetical protein